MGYFFLHLLLNMKGTTRIVPLLYYVYHSQPPPVTHLLIFIFHVKTIFVQYARYCREEKESQELERLLHCDGIWLHALRYEGKGWLFQVRSDSWLTFYLIPFVLFCSILFYPTRFHCSQTMGLYYLCLTDRLSSAS